MHFEIPQINTQKNLLAFSSGVDSTALFFILLEKQIPFDIAIVDYNTREESKEEVNYAKQLAKKFDKEIFIKEVKLESNSNFEKLARDIRYKFFEELIENYSYETLVTAHQLNDKLEWFLMQLTQGAGLVELIGFEEFTKKENYTLIKPLLNYTKDELQNFLDKKKIKYFIDKSNFDEKYKRNYFRKNFSNKLLDEFSLGIKKSFDYLQKDLGSLNIDVKALLKVKELEIFETLDDDNLNIRIIDLSLKRRGILLSSKQRNEILKQRELVVSHKISINISKNYIFICPFETCTMPKKFKELCRVNKIPKNIRAYIFKNELFDKVKNLVF